jgi:hypothetical protein
MKLYSEDVKCQLSRLIRTSSSRTHVCMTMSIKLSIYIEVWVYDWWFCGWWHGHLSSVPASVWTRTIISCPCSLHRLAKITYFISSLTIAFYCWKCVLSAPTKGEFFTLPAGSTVPAMQKENDKYLLNEVIGNLNLKGQNTNFMLYATWSGI